MPQNTTLLENKVIIRDHSRSNVKAAMDLWWNELRLYVKRDQLSLPYVLWKHQLKYQVRPASTWQGHSFFQRYGHKKHGLGHVRQVLIVRRFEPGFRQIFDIAKFAKKNIMSVKRIKVMLKKLILRECPPSVVDTSKKHGVMKRTKPEGAPTLNTVIPYG